jgi:putrescine carbamoyltransferase
VLRAFPSIDLVIRDFVDTQDLPVADLRQLLGLIAVLRAADHDRCVPPLLHGRSLALVFEEPSTRTRVSFDVAMQQLGGHSLFLRPGEIHLGQRESLGDTARVLSSMCDGIVIRALEHATVEELAATASVPVINGLSDYIHPTQALCDLYTMATNLPEGKALEDCTVVFVGDRTNVCSSTMFITTAFGMHFAHAAPERYQVPTAWRSIAERNLAAAEHGSVSVTDEVEDAVAKADFVYTDLWWWVDQEDEIPERRAAFMPRYQVNSALMSRAPTTARFLHCLPASRGVEVTDEVLDGTQSLAFEQAENRLHTERALLAWALGTPAAVPSPALQEWHEGRVRSLLSEIR